MPNAGCRAQAVGRNLGQLQTAQGKESGGATSRLHEQFGYAYDPAGNLGFRTNNALVEAFGVNSLNELSAETNSGTLTVAGTTTSQTTNVTVNSQTAVLYGDATFAKDGFTLADGANTFTALAQDNYGRRDTNSVTVNLPATNVLAYDSNGNLVTNGPEVLVYNDENQLVTNWVSASWKSEFVYDGLHRRRIERDYSWSGSSWALTNEMRLIYDGNAIIQHRDARNLPTLTLTRGLDLGGTFQSAGGIGGLLALTQPLAINSQHLYLPLRRQRECDLSYQLEPGGCGQSGLRPVRGLPVIERAGGGFELLLVFKQADSLAVGEVRLPVPVVRARAAAVPKSRPVSQSPVVSDLPDCKWRLDDAAGSGRIDCRTQQLRVCGQ